MLNLKLFLDMIKQNGIVRIEARFNGGGDSGSMDEVNIYDKNNQLIDPKNRGRVEIKKNKSIFDPKTETWKQILTYEAVEIDQAIEGLMEKALDQVDLDWYNNEGGGGDITIDFNEKNPEVNIYAFAYQERRYEEDENGDLIDDDYEPEIGLQSNQTIELKDLL